MAGEGVKRLPLTTTLRRRKAMEKLIQSAEKETGIALPPTEESKLDAKMRRFAQRMHKKTARGKKVTPKERSEFSSMVKAFAKERAEEQINELFRKELNVPSSQEASVPGITEPIQRERKMKADPRLREDFGTLLT